MTLTAQHVAACRRQFPALTRTVGGLPAVFLDGPGGTQVPSRVIEAVGDYLAHTNANHGGHFATSRQSDEMLAEASRQGLRLQSVGRLRSNSLGFLFGD